MDKIEKPHRWTRFLRVSSRDLFVTVVPVALALSAAIWAVLHFVRPAAPSTITISTGPDGSSFQRAAERYGKAFAANGVTLKVRPSNGSLENLRRLADPDAGVDVGFVQVGVKLPDPQPGERRRELASLGTISRQPLYILVHGAAPPDRLSALAGKRLVIGPEGSGTRVLALALLKANGIEPGGPTTMLDLDDDLVGDALEQGYVDAAFLMGDSASPRVIRSIIERPGVHVLQLSQVEAYLRKFQDLDRVVIPMGAYDLAHNMPATDLDLVASSVELVARADLHPAISDLLIETMREVHGRPFLLQRAGEFPVAREHDLPLSADARRYYESGKRWLYRMLPFWAASLADRFLMVLVPLVLLLVPVFRLVPQVYAWRVRARLYRIYGSLLELERDVLDHAAEHQAGLLDRLDAIERRADALKLPVAFADQFYVLREHIGFVRRRLTTLAGERRRAL
ncbi:TAXI family TRAP transporter solute-binding subunit [Anaeromyxobacter sp. SG64]|uniref:TAXI family TRAP transporter solute-binding subunit n=1 Tax=Anaeromyxobacter sp. SG64 TaxID=2925409 RepID=UPI001F57535B|nr:TAXI family TRAP transporter solute-binding subunit [Anaeromyxobacter sp. SG64]